MNCLVFVNVSMAPAAGSPLANFAVQSLRLSSSGLSRPFHGSVVLEDGGGSRANLNRLAGVWQIEDYNLRHVDIRLENALICGIDRHFTRLDQLPVRRE